MKPSHAWGATQDGWVMVEKSDRMWSTGEGNGKPLQYSCLENPMNSMKRQKDLALKDEHSRSVVPNMLLEISGDFIFWAPKSLQMVTAAMKLKDTCSLEEKL